MQYFSSFRACFPLGHNQVPIISNHPLSQPRTIESQDTDSFAELATIESVKTAVKRLLIAEYELKSIDEQLSKIPIKNNHSSNEYELAPIVTNALNDSDKTNAIFEKKAPFYFLKNEAQVLELKTEEDKLNFQSIYDKLKKKVLTHTKIKKYLESIYDPEIGYKVVHKLEFTHKEQNWNGHIQKVENHFSEIRVVLINKLSKEQLGLIFEGCYQDERDNTISPMQTRIVRIETWNNREYKWLKDLDPNLEADEYQYLKLNSVLKKFFEAMRKYLVSNIRIHLESTRVKELDIESEDYSHQLHELNIKEHFEILNKYDTKLRHWIHFSSNGNKVYGTLRNKEHSSTVYITDKNVKYRLLFYYEEKTPSIYCFKQVSKKLVGDKNWQPSTEPLTEEQKDWIFDFEAALKEYHNPHKVLVAIKH